MQLLNNNYKFIKKLIYFNPNSIRVSYHIIMEKVIINAQIYEDFNGNGYYELNTESGVQYDIRFPLKLATDCFANIPQIGPEHCNNCRNFASYKGMMITLCGNCIDFVPEEYKYKCDCNDGATSQEFNIDEQLVELRCEGFMTIGCDKVNCIYKTYLKDLPIKEWDALYTAEGKYKFTSTSSSTSTSTSSSTSTSEDDSSEEDLYSIATDAATTDTDSDTYKNAKVADINSPINKTKRNHIIYISSASEDDNNEEQSEDEQSEDEQSEDNKEEDDKEEKEEGEISDDEVVYSPSPYVTSRPKKPMSKEQRPRKAQLIANDLCGQDSEEFEQYLDCMYI